MLILNIILEGDNCWEDLKGKTIHHVREGIQVATLEGGTTSGKPSVSIRIPISDKEVVIAETTLALFLTAADAFKAKHGDPRQ